MPAEVTDFVAGLGFQAEFQGILDGIPEVFPEALGVQCQFDPGVPDEEDPTVVTTVRVEDRGPTDPTPHMLWDDWALARYPGRVLYHFPVIVAHVRTAHAGS